MCYRIRQEHSAHEPAGATPPLTSEPPRRLRPAWIGAGVAALVAGLAAAALVTPSPAADPPAPKSAAPLVPVAAATVTAPVAPVARVVDQVTLDDGVPTAPDTRASAFGHCNDAP